MSILTIQYNNWGDHSVVPGVYPSDANHYIELFVPVLKRNHSYTLASIVFLY